MSKRLTRPSLPLPGLPAALLLAFLLAGPAMADTPLVLVVNSYHADYPWVASHNRALSQGLEGAAELVFLNMDTKRLNPAHHTDRAALALARFRDLKPNLAVLADDYALAALARDVTRTGTPVVYMGINANPRHYAGDTNLMTGVLERPMLKRSIVFLQDILGHPLDRCLVLFDHGPTARATLDTAFGGRAHATVGATRTDIALTNSFKEWKALVRDAGVRGYGALILGLYQTIADQDGNHVPEEEVARWTSANSPVPVFAFWDFAVGPGKAVGGLVLAGRQQGVEAAKLVRRVLAGEPPSRIPPVTAEQGRFVFSRSGLQRWHITLPPDLARPSEPIEFRD